MYDQGARKPQRTLLFFLVNARMRQEKLFVSAKMPTQTQTRKEIEALQIRLTPQQKANLQTLANIKKINVTQLIEDCIDALP
jgi:L-rhamnose isomerase